MHAFLTRLHGLRLLKYHMGFDLDSLGVSWVRERSVVINHCQRVHLRYICVSFAFKKKRCLHAGTRPHTHTPGSRQQIPGEESSRKKPQIPPSSSSPSLRSSHSHSVGAADASSPLLTSTPAVCAPCARFLFIPPSRMCCRPRGF